MGDWAADVSEQDGPGDDQKRGDDRSGGAGAIVALDGLERI